MPAASVAAVIDVDMINIAFSPNSVTIQVGDTVRWTNKDLVPHTTTSDALLWDSGLLSTGQQFEFKFLQPGTFTYHCGVHPLTMKDANVIVQGSLGADTDQVSESSGGSVNFILEAGGVHASRTYLLLGSITGTSPGTPLPGGMAVLPLNWDLFTGIVISLLNTPVFLDFTGTLDAAGTAAASMNLGPVPGAAGLTMHFAYALNNPWDFASNPFSVEIVP